MEETGIDADSWQKCLPSAHKTSAHTQHKLTVDQGNKLRHYAFAFVMHATYYCKEVRTLAQYLHVLLHPYLLDEFVV